jgi:glyoxylase-like metal-dependent hydrolase (beta-lactamase superfamily II)
MKPLTVGDVAIAAIIEREGPWRRPEDYFPQVPAETLAARLAELEPNLFDAASGMLPITFQSFLVRTPHHTVLIDTCVGEDKTDRWPEFVDYPKRPWLDNLHAAGVTVDQIDFVLCTHLHVDHVGWNTRLVDGRWVPTFPNARYVFARREYEHWESAGGDWLDHGGAPFHDSVLPIVEAGRAVLVDDDHAIDDTIYLTPSPGHTPGHVCVNVASNGAHALFTGDMMHHALQCLEPGWSTRFCSDPDLAAATRRAVLGRCADTGTMVLPAHFPAPTAGHVVGHGDAFRFKFLSN